MLTKSDTSRREDSAGSPATDVHSEVGIPRSDNSETLCCPEIADRASFAASRSHTYVAKPQHSTPTIHQIYLT